MPISDTYIVQYLLEGTLDVPSQIRWCEKHAEQSGHVARVEEVDVILEPVYSRAGAHLVLRFRHGGDEFTISEPAAGGWLGRKLSTPDQRDLSTLFRKLSTAVAAQCASRRQRAEQNHEKIRERIGRRLLFGEPSETRAERLSMAGRL